MGTSKHAYLIQAHNQPELLKLLIHSLDVEENDLFLHLDAKSPLSYEQFSGITSNASIRCCKRQSVAWGGYSEIQCELGLLGEAVSSGHHCYYHLLSGSDLPLKSIRAINDFYDSTGGKEFINFEDPSRYSCQYELRLKYKHYFREKCGREKNLFTALNKALWLVQKGAHIYNAHTIPEQDFLFGSQWFDITEDLALYVLDCEESLEHLFKYTSCGDEVFLQYLVWNSEWRTRLWRPALDNGMEGNMRYINWQGSVNAGPRTIDDSLIDDALSSGMMFGRKFDYENYPESVRKVLSKR